MVIATDVGDHRSMDESRDAFAREFPALPWPEVHPFTKEGFVRVSCEPVGDSELFTFTAPSGATAEGSWNGTEWKWITATHRP